MSKADGRVFYGIVSQLTGQPCGAEIQTTITTTTGKTMKMKSVRFPLLRKEDEDDCVVWFNQSVERKNYKEPAVNLADVKHLEWIDIGAKTPWHRQGRVGPITKAAAMPRAGDGTRA